MNRRILFVEAPGIPSALIAREGISQGGFSHAASMLADDSIIDARDNAIKVPYYYGPPIFPSIIPAGVQHRPPFYDPTWIRKVVVEIPCTDEQEAAAVAFLRSHIGAQYDSKAIENFIFGVPLHGNGDFMCSALVVAELRASGILHPNAVDEWLIPPDTLYMILTQGLEGVRTITLA